MGGWTGKLVIVAFATALAVGSFEVGLRAFAQVAPQLELDIYRKDSDGLLLLQPNVVRRHVARLWDVTVHINSDGWRDDERQPEAGDYVVVGLGDSQAFGWGVALPQTFYSHVEKRLRRRSPSRLIKAGVPASATVDQVKVLERVLPVYRPQAVVLAFFVGNDFTENGLGGSERLEVEHGLLTLRPRDGARPAMGERTRRWVARRSHLAQLIRAVQFNLQRPKWNRNRGRVWDAWMRDFAQIHLRRPNEETRNGIEVTLKSLDRIVTLSAAHSVETLVVVVVPRSLQVYPEETQEMCDALGVGPDDLDLDAGQELLREWQAGAEADLRVRLVDPLPAFRAAAKEGQALYFAPDAHLSPEGHALVAEVIGEAAARD